MSFLDDISAGLGAFGQSSGIGGYVNTLEGATAELGQAGRSFVGAVQTGLGNVPGAISAI